MGFTPSTSQERFHVFRRDCHNILRKSVPTTFLAQEPLFIGLDTVLRQTGHYSIHSLPYWNENANSHGMVFTPEAECRHLVENLQLDFSQTIKVLDPACGSGLLLAALVRQAAPTLSSPEKAATFLQQSVFGIDRDPVAVYATRYTLLLLLDELFPREIDRHLKAFPLWRNNISCGDFLSSREADQRKKLNSLSLRHTFTHIIANPPYGLSRNDQIGKDLLRHYKIHYRDYLSGKPNKYLLFLMRSLEFLDGGGRLSFLIPNSWLGIISAKKIRTFLLTNGYIRSIDLFDARSFGKKGVETIFLALQKLDAPAFSVRRFQNKESVELRDTIELGTEDLLQDGDDAIIPLYQSNRDAMLWGQMAKNSTPLTHSGIPFTPRIALQIYSTGRGIPPQTQEVVKSHTFHERTPSDSSSIKYLQGKDIGRYQIGWSGDYVRYGEWVSEFQPIERYMGPRILIREVLGKDPFLFLATYTEETLIYNRSILHILPDENAENKKELCLALLALINSKAGSFFLKTRGRKASRRLFPKIVNDDLKCFPIPHRFAENISVLAEYAKKSLQNEKSAMEMHIANLYGINCVEELWEH